MDPVSHVALGYAVIHLRPASPRAASPAAVTLVCVFNNIYVVLLPMGWDRYVVAHQAGTHSLVGAIICGVLAGALAHAVRRGNSFAVLAGAAIVGALSHLWFDHSACASIMIWWPFARPTLSDLGLFAMAPFCSPLSSSC